LRFLSPGFVCWFVFVAALGGSFVAGRSHGLGCTAASGTGADQCRSLPDSSGRPYAAKSAQCGQSEASDPGFCALMNYGPPDEESPAERHDNATEEMEI